MKINGNWIWIDNNFDRENRRVCFYDDFYTEDMDSLCELYICATEKYMVYINGVLQGFGPARSIKEIGYLERYDITPFLNKGINEITIAVWNYGCSTYQSVYDNGKLIFEIRQQDNVISASGKNTRCMEDGGFISDAPKRNVNLGYSDYYDGRKFDQKWIIKPAELGGWGNAVICEDVKKELKTLSERKRTIESKRPKRVVRVQDVKKNCKVFTVNTRRAFFGNRKDANETNFNAFLGCIIISTAAQSGRISFPNRTWNGIFGSFRIGKNEYSVSDRNRDIVVELQEGDNFFMMQIHGKYDDLYSHIEFRFENDIVIRSTDQKSGFFVIGPTSQITTVHDGKHEIFDDINYFTDNEKIIFSCTSLQELKEKQIHIKSIAPNDVMEDAYILSLSRLGIPMNDYSVKEEHLGLLWSGDESTTFLPPKSGDYKRIIVDFGDIYMGYLKFMIKAPKNTVLDIYGFENMYRGEPDYTIGLNNGVRYICKDGWQTYTCMSKMGMRYAMLNIYGNKDVPVQIREFEIMHEMYAVANRGYFECDNEKLNRIWKMCEQTMRDSVSDTYADSPTYEQAYWLGDSLVSMNVDAYMFGDYEFIRHNIILGMTAGKVTPLGNALTPTDWVTPIPMWTMNWIIMVDEYIKLTGDKKILKEVYSTLKDRLDYYANLLTEDGGFIVKAWNLVDWAPMDISNNCVCTAYQGILAHCYDIAAKHAEILGNKDESKIFETIASRIRTYLSTVLWDNERKAYRDGWSPISGLSKTFSIQTHTLLLFYQAVKEPERRELIKDYIKNKPEDFLDVGSPFLLYYLYGFLAETGEIEAVINDMEKRWGEMLRYDSTTCWEVFPGFYENSRTRSYCHAWSTVPAMLMQKFLLGIKRDEDGFKKISIVMKDTSLKWCRGSIPTPYGDIEVTWDKYDKEFSVRIPEQIEIGEVKVKGFSVTIKRTL